MHLDIRPIAAGEYGAVSEMLREGLSRFVDVGGIVTASLRRIERMEKVYTAPGACFLVACNLDGVLGGVGWGPFAGLNPIDAVGEIRELFVIPEARRLGVGHELLKSALTGARQQYQRIYLETTPDMRDATMLFRRFGFRPVQGTPTKHSHNEGVAHYYLLESSLSPSAATI